MKNQNQYKTTDLACAAAMALFVSINAIELSEPRRAVFVFEKNSKFDVLLNKYWQGRLKIEPRAYFDQLKSLKTRIYEIN